jgi:REP element-mobilizing transposase RayT
MQAKERYQFYLYAYCLMTNHYHLLIETKLANISKIMHYINGSYTIYYNISHRRCGHLFQGRYKSIVVDRASYFSELSRYIHLNPVRAGVVEHPAEYRWSSYRGYLGGRDDYIDVDQVRNYLGMNIREYRRFVLGGVGKVENPLRKVYAGFLLGSIGFIKQRLQDLETQIASASDEVSHKQALLDDRLRAKDVILGVTTYYKISLNELLKSKTRPTIRRQVLIYLLRRHTGLTNHEIGDIVGMSYSAVSKAGLAVERILKQNRSIEREIKAIVSSFEG